MSRSVLILAAGLALLATPAAAQYADRHADTSWRGAHDGYRPHRSNSVPSNFDWRSQLDRPGDYRCDQFWDANRDDCGDYGRDLRHRVSRQARSEYRALAGYGRGHGRRGYGSAYGHAQGSTTYHGAYGRPDHVYPGGGTRHGGYSGGYGGSSYGGSSYGGGHGAGRSDWCRATYRSYDPATGYYRAYSGQLIYCG